jgi:hypothetical protein
MTAPENLLLFQIIIVPLEAPTGGIYSKMSKEIGQNFFMYERSKTSRYVSCRHIISQFPKLLIAYY